MFSVTDIKNSKTNSSSLLKSCWPIQSWRILSFDDVWANIQIFRKLLDFIYHNLLFILFHNISFFWWDDVPKEHDVDKEYHQFRLNHVMQICIGNLLYHALGRQNTFLQPNNKKYFVPLHLFVETDIAGYDNCVGTQEMKCNVCWRMFVV